jgi:hypothetical protein
MKNTEPWTVKLVSARIDEAVNTLKRLPEKKIQGYFCAWPDTLPGWEAYGWEKARTRLGPPSPDAIDRMDEAMEWFRWITPDQAKLVWSRSEKIQWKLIMRQLGVSRETARQRLIHALVIISSRLNQLEIQKNA